MLYLKRMASYLWICNHNHLIDLNVDKTCHCIDFQLLLYLPSIVFPNLSSSWKLRSNIQQRGWASTWKLLVKDGIIAACDYFSFTYYLGVADAGLVLGVLVDLHFNPENQFCVLVGSGWSLFVTVFTDIGPAIFLS